ncbi:MAG: amidohydrolase, partial [Acidobacteria bacterium]
MRKSIFAVLICLLAVAPAAGQELSEKVRQFVKVDAPVVALVHVRVIDGTGGPAREDQIIILSQGKIASISDAAAAQVSKDAQVLDLHGYSVIPGLVGMHDHLFYPMGDGI